LGVAIVSSKRAGRIQIRVREILRDGAELLEGGKRRHPVDAWERRIFPAYLAYGATLIGGRQRLIAGREFARIRREIFVYPEDELDVVDDGPLPGVPAPGPAASIEIVPEELDVDLARARLLMKFVRENNEAANHRGATA